MATFPSGIYSHTTLYDNVDDVLASHPNTLGGEINALETKVGVTSSSVATTIDYFLKHASGAYRTHKHDGTSDDGDNIPDTSLNQITTASKVSGTALTLLANIPAGAGDIPSANLPLTIDEVRTFTSVPVLPASDPTTDNEASRRKFITDKFDTTTGHDHDGTDSKKLGASGISAVLGAWVDKSSSYGAQQAATDGFVLARGTIPNGAYIGGYSDANSNPTTSRTYFVGNPSQFVVSITMPVKKGDYWKITTDGNVDFCYWIPLGS